MIHTRLFQRFLPGFLIGLLQIGCGDGFNPDQRLLDNIDVPIRSGQIWEYDTQIETRFPAHSIYDQSTSTVEVLGYEFLPNNIEAIAVAKTDVYSDGFVAENFGWYSETNRGLLEEAYTLGDHGIIMKDAPDSALRYTFRGETYTGLPSFRQGLRKRIAPDEEVSNASGKTTQMIVHRSPLLTLPYPCVLGESWVNGVPGEPSHRKTVRRVEFIETPTGRQRAIRVEMEYDLDGDGRYEPDLFVIQHWNNRGLVREIYDARDVFVYDPVSNTDRVADYIEISTLF